MDQEPTSFPWLLPLDDPRLPYVVGMAVALLVFLLLFIVFWRRMRRRDETVVAPPIDVAIDVTRLATPAPVNSSFQVEVYGTPVRLAVIVLAPVGRDGTLPSQDEFLATIEQLVPGFSEAVLRDRPVIRGWSGQLSSQGFAQSFFNNVALPGERGKGSPWCSLVGKFTARGQLFLAGIVCRANVDNALSQYVVQHEGQWNDILRVRNIA